MTCEMMLITSLSHLDCNLILSIGTLGGSEQSEYLLLTTHKHIYTELRRIYLRRTKLKVVYL